MPFVDSFSSFATMVSNVCLIVTGTMRVRTPLLQCSKCDAFISSSSSSST
jgi:hypothetical protein